MMHNKSRCEKVIESAVRPLEQIPFVGTALMLIVFAILYVSQALVKIMAIVLVVTSPSGIASYYGMQTVANIYAIGLVALFCFAIIGALIGMDEMAY